MRPDSITKRLEKKIKKLQEKLDKAESLSWTQHKEYPNPKEAPGADLPVPRLEVRWEEIPEKDKGDGYQIQASYCLVYKHLCGQTIFVPLGLTRSSGTLSSRVNHNGSVDLPFRDGCHFQNEMKQLNLRGFGICGDVTYEFRICEQCKRIDAWHREVDYNNGKCILPVLEDK